VAALMTVAAWVLGGHALVRALSIALAVAWRVARAEAALSAIQGSFLVYTVAVLWAFAARSALTAWLGLPLPAALVAWVLV
jgi:hypothetical protein